MLGSLYSELRRLLEVILGRKSVEYWIDSIQHFASTQIEDFLNDQSLEYKNGECTAVYTPGIGVETRIELVFITNDRQIKTVTSHRNFPEKYFLTDSLQDIIERETLTFKILND